MGKRSWGFLFLLVCRSLFAQDIDLPPDLRQHDLQWISPSVFNPVFSLDQDSRHRLGFWSRWQWQTIDGDPTTLLFNYNLNLGRIATGAGFFQNNTNLYLQTGALLNFAYRYPITPEFSISGGLNMSIYQQKLADDRLIITDPNLPIADDTEDMIFQLAPALGVEYKAFGAGLVLENLFDYNFDYSEAETGKGEKILLAMAYYQFELPKYQSRIRPMLYVKNVPGYDTQIGINGLYVAPYFWAQGGYNSFYGLSIGGGTRIFDRVSIGGILEFGSPNSPENNGMTYELVASLSLGRKLNQDIAVDPDAADTLVQEAALEEKRKRQDSIQAVAADRELALQRQRDSLDSAQQRAEAVAEQVRRDSLETARKEAAALAEQARRDSLETARREAAALAEQARRDSIAAVEREAAADREAAALAAQLRRDSLDAVRQEEERIALERRRDSVQRAEALAAEQARAEDVTPETGEKYQEAAQEGDIQPGYYLIANVFGTQRYYEAFMQELTGQGLEPKSFYRSVNKFNYVYLQRYNTIEEARQARDSDFGGRYSGDIWIFRIR